MVDHFLGEFEEGRIQILKKYIDTEEKNIRLYHTRYTPENPTRTLCIVHGFGQHSGRFYEIAMYFANLSYEVLLIDLTGFGYSGGPRGCATIQMLQNDVMILLKQAREDLPLYVYAHSLGGLITIKLAIDRPTIPITGYIITSPLLGFPKERHLSWPKIFIVKQIGDGLEDVIINSMVNPTALTKNNKFIHTIFEDRLMIPFLSIKMAKSIFEAVEFVNTRFDRFKYPVIVFHGKKDSVTNYEDSKRFIQTNLTPEKRIHLFENGFHELQHDEERDELLDKGATFLASLSSSKLFGRFVIEKIPRKKPSQIHRIIALVLAILTLLGLILKKLKKK